MTHILLVDDDEDDFVIARDLIAEIPGELDLRWERSLDRGLAAWRGGAIDLILLDYRLGGENGLDLLRTVRDSGSHVPVIVLTSQSEREIDVAAMVAGASDYLVKSELTAAALDRSMRYALSLAELNQRLIGEQERLIRVEKLSSLGLLAASIVHEVNNPLAGVKTLVEALRDEKLPQPKRSEYITAISEGLARMSDTIRGLLDLTREQPLSISSVDLYAVTASSLRLVAPSLRTKGIAAEVRIADGERVTADRSRLMQALLNLIMNASDATPPGGSITITLRRNAGEAALVVTDTGSGIPKEIAERVTEPFFTTKPLGKGTGLGLAVVNNIAKAHGGRLVIESEPGKGTTIMLWIKDR